MVFIAFKLLDDFFLIYFHRMLNHHQTSPFLCFLKHLLKKGSINPTTSKDACERQVKGQEATRRSRCGPKIKIPSRELVPYLLSNL